MVEAQTVIAFPAADRASNGGRVRSHKAAPALRNRTRTYPAAVVPLFTGRTQPRERSQAGLGLVIAFGFSAICWAGLAALIF